MVKVIKVMIKVKAFNFTKAMVKTVKDKVKAIIAMVKASMKAIKTIEDIKPTNNINVVKAI